MTSVKISPASAGGETVERSTEGFDRENDRWDNRAGGIHIAGRTARTSSGVGSKYSSDRPRGVDQCPPSRAGQRVQGTVRVRQQGNSLGNARQRLRFRAAEEA